MDYDAIPLEGWRKIVFYCITWGRGGQNAAKFAAGEVFENKQKLNRSFFSYNNSSSISLWQNKAVSPQTYIRDMSTPKNFWHAWGRISLEIKVQNVLKRRGGKILKANKKILSQCYCLWCSFLLFWYSLRRFQNCLCKLRFPIRFYQFRPSAPFLNMPKSEMPEKGT